MILKMIVESRILDFSRMKLEVPKHEMLYSLEEYNEQYYQLEQYHPPHVVRRVT